MKTDLLTFNNDTTELNIATDAEVRQNTEKSIIPNDLNADWVKKHVERFGVEPNVFDGA